MKIIHYIPSIDEKSGGLGAYMQLLTRDLGKLCELHVITHKENNERTLENCSIHYLPNKWQPWSNCKKEFLAILEKIHPDVFHSNSCWEPLCSMTVFWTNTLRKERNEFKNLKIVYSPHGMLEPYAISRHYWIKKLPAILLYQKRALKNCDLIHSTADTEKNNLIKLGWNKNIKVIANCVQIDKIEIKKTWKKTHKILFLSRIHPKKGINFLIEAVGQLKEEMREYTITIAGLGEEGYVNELKELAIKNGVPELFEFIGPVFGSTKWPLYRNADLFVLPTISENFGIVVPEALASGTPVISTNGAPWEILNEYHCGWCTDVGTNPTIDALIKFLACSESDLERMGRKGRDLVEEKYSSISVAKQFVDMYHFLNRPY